MKLFGMLILFFFTAASIRDLIRFSLVTNQFYYFISAGVIFLLIGFFGNKLLRYSFYSILQENSQAEEAMYKYERNIRKTQESLLFSLIILLIAGLAVQLLVLSISRVSVLTSQLQPTQLITYSLIKGVYLGYIIGILSICYLNFKKLFLMKE